MKVARLHHFLIEFSQRPRLLSLPAHPLFLLPLCLPENPIYSAKLDVLWLYFFVDFYVVHYTFQCMGRALAISYCDGSLSRQ